MKSHLTFIEPLMQVCMMDMLDPPALPNVGDITESPDGKLWVILRRAYLPPVAKGVLAINPATDPNNMLEIRCTIAQIDETGAFVDPRYNGGQVNAKPTDTI